MIQSKMIEIEDELQVCSKHKSQIIKINCDRRLMKNERLLCESCIINLKPLFILDFKEAVEKIVENQKSMKESVENVLVRNIQQLKQLQDALHQLKTKVVQQLDNLIYNSNKWIENVQEQGQTMVTYSFLDELEKLIIEQKLDQPNQNSIIDKINEINYQQNKNVINKLNQFKQFQETEQCEELIKSLDNINILLKQQLKQQLMIDKQIELKLIDQQINQRDKIDNCRALVFDKTGSIMISCEYHEIKIWNFEQGRLKLIKKYQVHTQAVTCLVYSKMSNNFISGAHDKTIICWQQKNKEGWKHSQPFQIHSQSVNCLILNENEDQLISGDSDKSIKVWKVDFMKNQLTFQYSLDKHSNNVCSLSFNSSETILASCGISDFIIWEKGAQGQWQYKYTESVSNKGFKIHLINDRQFLWVTLDQKVDDILVFELENGVFKQNNDKTIKLSKNDQYDDVKYFPIIYNRAKNILLVRHKQHIYLIRNETFKIMAQLNCQVDEIFGNLTNNGQYLVFWDKKQKQYQSYELLDK